MARPAETTREILTPLIQARGPISATELAALLRVNRTTIARTLPDFGDDLVTLGATRSTRYLLRRTIRNIGNRWPLYLMDREGRARACGELEALHDRQWRVHWTDEAPAWASHFMEENGLWSGFPFFLGDARPQGFLGRAIAGRISRAMQLPEDPTRWGDEETLIFLQAAGEDLPGNWVVGDDCLREALARAADLLGRNVIAESARETFYPAQAVEISQSLPGSSAGGEQPKFLTTLQREFGEFQAVLVKFSSPLDQATAQRWADLLLCEFHAHQVLAAAGLTMPGAQLIDAGGRRFLEIPRFDRVGRGGRLGVVSLLALGAGEMARDWTEAARELLQRGLIDAASLRTIQRLHAFGELIGNTDMHFGNLAFFLGEAMPLPVTPCYDMLPMLWSPGSQGEIMARTFSPAPPLPAQTESWRTAAVWAEDFWARVVADPRLSEGFREIAVTAGDTLRRLRQHVGS